MAPFKARFKASCKTPHRSSVLHNSATSAADLTVQTYQPSILQLSICSYPGPTWTLATTAFGFSASGMTTLSMRIGPTGDMRKAELEDAFLESQMPVPRAAPPLSVGDALHSIRKENYDCSGPLCYGP